MPVKLIIQPGLPNVDFVTVYLKYRGITVDMEEVNVLARDAAAVGDLRSTEEQKKKYPYGALPMLVLEDGTLISESNAIVDYFEAAHPVGALGGSTPAERAIRRMWNDRVEKTITEFGDDAFRTTDMGVAMFKDRWPCYAESHKLFVDRYDFFLTKLNGLMSDDGYIAGPTPTIADIRLYTNTMFTLNENFGAVGKEAYEKCDKIKAFHERCSKAFGA